MAYFRSGISNIQKFKGTAVDVTDLPSPIASFRSNASGVKLDSLKVLVEAVQSGSGTPSPDNVRPITGWSGAVLSRVGSRNILDPNATKFGNYTISPDGSHNEATDRLATHYLRCKGNTSYKAISDKKITYYTYAFLDIAFYDENLNYISRSYTNNTNNSFTFTTPANAKFLVYSEQFSGLSNVTPAVFETYDRCLVEGDIDSYEPFVGNTYTIQFGDTYYGGELDVTNGVLRVTNAIVDLGGLTWVYANNAFAATGITGIVDYALKTNTPMLCSHYNYLGTNGTGTAWFADKADRTCGSFFVNGNPNRAIYVKDTDYTDAVTFKSAMDGVKIYYELATPFTIQLSPQQIEQLEENNIWADTGDVSECKYIQISQIGG